MIQFDESEQFHTFLDEDSTLGVLVSFIDLIGPEAYDGLLYAGDKYVGVDRLGIARSGSIFKARVNNDNDTGPYDIWYPSDDQEPEDTAEDAKVRSLADTG